MAAEDTRIALFCDTVARPMPDGRWALMHRQDQGWRSRCQVYASTTELLQSVRVRLGEHGTDEHGPFVRVIREGGSDV